MYKKKIIVYLILIFLSNKTYVFAYSGFGAGLAGGLGGMQSSDKGDRLSKEKEEEIKKNKHGYIKIIFPNVYYKNKTHSNVPDRWSLSLIVNDEVYLKYSVFDSEEFYKIPVPASRIEIKYKLASNMQRVDIGPDGGLRFRTGDWIQQKWEEKILIINVKESETINLKINYTDPSWGMGCCLIFPFPFLMQENFLVPDVEQVK